eukprot:4024666-Karenia_brevis.AAC.1
MLKTLKALRLMSWNCRALFHHDANKRLPKLNFLVQLAQKYDIILLQETHGNRHDFDRLQHRMKEFKLIRNAGVNASTGGLL